MKKYFLILLLATCFGCTSSSRKEIVTINLTEGGKSLKISGIDNDILEDINRDTVSNVWLSLVPVYKMPQDTDMKDFQHAQPGKYTVAGNTVIFTPDTPFTKQQTYFVRWFHYDEAHKPADYLVPGKRVGKISYSDLEFKP